MEAKELRIGNLVKVFHGIDDDGPVFLTKHIASISIHDVYFNVDNCENVMSVFRAKSNEIEPIEITEDWLITLGFELNMRENKFEKLYSKGQLTYNKRYG